MFVIKCLSAVLVSPGSWVSLWTINFSENLWRYSWLNVYLRCQRHRWKIYWRWLIPVNGLLSPAINLRLFVYFWPVSMSPRKNVIAGANNTGNKLLWPQRDVSGRRGRMLPPWKGASIDTSHTCPCRDPWGRQNWFKTNLFYTYSHWQKRPFRWWYSQAIRIDRG